MQKHRQRHAEAGEGKVAEPFIHSFIHCSDGCGLGLMGGSSLCFHCHPPPRPQPPGVQYNLTYLLAPPTAVEKRDLALECTGLYFNYLAIPEP